MKGNNHPIYGSFARGSAWMMSSQYGTYAVQIVFFAVLARLLLPDDFGLVAMVMVYTGFARILVENGLALAVIQDRPRDDATVSTIFWTATGAAAIVIVLTLFIARWIEALFDTAGLATVVRVTSIVLLFSAASSIVAARLRASLRFGLVAISSLTSSVVAGVSAILAAVAGWGYWSLVIQILVSACLNAIILLLAGGWRPHLRFDAAVVRRVLPLSSHLIGFDAFNYWARNADDFLIGRYLGAGQLGFYSLAYKLMLVPQQGLTTVFSRVLHPALKAAPDDSRHGRELYVSVLNIVSRIAAMSGAFMAVMAPEIVLTLWGGKWLPSAPVFRWLALVSILQVPTATSGAALLGKGRSDLYFWQGVFATIATVITFALTVSHGIVVLAQAYLLLNLALAPLIVGQAYSLYTTDYRRLLRIVVASATGGLSVALLALSVRIFSSTLPPWAQVLIAGIFTASFATIFLWKTTGIAGVLELLKNRPSVVTDPNDRDLPEE